jgi:hypothetical protein
MPDTSQNTETLRDAKMTASDDAPSAATQPAPDKPEGTEGVHRRSKMSKAFDEALAHNTLPTDGREGERLNQGEDNALSSNNVNNPLTAANVSAAPFSPPAPGQPSASSAENALSTQSEGKMAVGEEIRDREFPIPPQKSGAASPRLVVDQDTMSDEGSRPGEAVGTMPGDHQNVGEAPNIMDQHAQTPDQEGIYDP